MISNPANTKHLYNSCTASGQRLWHWSNIAHMLYKCFVFTGNVWFAFRCVITGRRVVRGELHGLYHGGTHQAETLLPFICWRDQGRQGWMPPWLDFCRQGCHSLLNYCSLVTLHPCESYHKDWDHYVLATSFCFIWIHMLWVYGHHRYFTLSVRGRLQTDV